MSLGTGGGKGVRLLKSERKSVPGKGNSMCKGPGLITSLLSVSKSRSVNLKPPESGWVKENESDHTGRQKQQTWVHRVGSRKKEGSKRRSQNKRRDIGGRKSGEGPIPEAR